MKLVSFERPDGTHGVGALTSDGAGVIDLGERMRLGEGGLRELFERPDGIDRARELVDRVQGEAAAGDEPLAGMRFDIPVRQPEKILCIGVNYAERNEEYKDGSAAPAYPSVFPRFARSFVGHERPLLRPPGRVSTRSPAPRTSSSCEGCWAPACARVESASVRS